jgi:phthiocerol/phenolphthiocerol synthesis type-I polyketide synthase A
MPDAKPYPGPHRIHGVDVVPASVLLETILGAAAEVGVAALSDIEFRRPILVDKAKFIQVVADREAITVASNSTVDGQWLEHLTARPTPALSAPNSFPVGAAADAHQEADASPHDETGSIADLLAVLGVEGPPFTWSIESCTVTGNEVFAEVLLEEPSTVAFLDAVMHIAPLTGLTGSLLVPAHVDHVRLGHAMTDSRGSVSIRRVGTEETQMIVDATARAADGTVCLSIRGLSYTGLEPAAAGPPRQARDPCTFAHAIEWQPVSMDDQPADQGGPFTVAVSGQGGRGLLNRLCDFGCVAGDPAAARYVVYAAEPPPARSAETEADCAVRMSADVASVVRALAARADTHPVRLWILTRGVQEAADTTALRQSPLWGLSAVIAAEHPDLWGGLLDIEGDGDIGDCAPVLARLLRNVRGSVMLLRDGVVLAPALVPIEGQRPSSPKGCRPDATYLVTGGMGALGLLMAHWLVDRGARRLILAGRTPLPPRSDWDSALLDDGTQRKTAAIRALERRGAAVDIAALDVGCRDDLMALMTARDHGGAPPIRGVIHAAGVTDDHLLNDVTEESLRKVMWPKIAGAAVLHDAFPPGSLDFFYLTSSAATIFGVPGQGAYAGANAYLDALARSRHGRGCRTVSLDWGAWQGLGFAADAPLVVHELERLGSRELTPEEAFVAWEHVNRFDVAQAVVIPLPGVDGDRGSQPVRAWSQIPAAELRRELEKGLRSILARELTTPEAEIDSDLPLVEMGLNSLTAMSVRREAEKFVGIELSATMLWNYPTVSALADHLVKRLSPGSESSDGAEPLYPSSQVLDALFDRVESVPASQDTVS